MPNKELLDQLEKEVMKELGIENTGKNMTTHEAGMIGGYMVKKLIEKGEQSEKVNREMMNDEE